MPNRSALILALLGMFALSSPALAASRCIANASGAAISCSIQTVSIDSGVHSAAAEGSGEELSVELAESAGSSAGAQALSPSIKTRGAVAARVRADRRMGRILRPT